MKLTKELYYKIKKIYSENPKITPKRVSELAEEYLHVRFSKYTMARIRNSKNFAEYQLKNKLDKRKNEIDNRTILTTLQGEIFTSRTVNEYSFSRVEKFIIIDIALTMIGSAVLIGLICFR